MHHFWEGNTLPLVMPLSRCRRSNQQHIEQDYAITHADIVIGEGCAIIHANPLVGHVQL